MNPYLAIPLISAIVCMACGPLILAREPDSVPHRCAAGLLLCAAFWATCETLWTSAGDAGTALALVRLSALGWVWAGPLTLHLFLSSAGRPPAWMPRALPWLYLVPAPFLAAQWFTDLMHHSVVPVPWGWAYQVGPGYALWYAFTIGTVCVGVVHAVGSLRRADTPAQLHQRPWLGLGVGLPLLLGSVTDAMLPLFDVHVPRFGVASFAALGLLTSWSLLRFGHTLMAPGSFADQILAGLPEGVAMTTPGGRIRFANRRFAELLGRTPETLSGARLGELIPEAPVDPPRELAEFECELTGADGGAIPVGISSTLLADKKQLLIGLVVIVRDLREVTELRRRLVVSGRLAAVGELAAGIAHEINNPLSFIGANLRLLGEHWDTLSGTWGKPATEVPVDDLLSEGGDLIQESIEGVTRAAAIVRDVKVLAHGGTGGRERVDVNAVVEHALRIARPQLAGVRIQRDLQPVPEIHASPGELEQVVLNLLMNSRSALGDGGSIRVVTRIDGSCPEQDWVEIAVVDDGSGIPDEILDRVFDPFFTTKPVGEGTGLGLSISHEIVRRHRGEVLVESNPESGTRMRVRLPSGLRRTDLE